MKNTILLTSILVLLFSCKETTSYDATGTFEADELLVVAEATGKILELKIEEGTTLTQDQQVGIIDGKGIELQKEQILASINALDEKTNSATPQIQVLQSQERSQTAQIAVLQKQLQIANRERNRTENLVRSDAATRKQLDDANGQVDVLQQQIAVAKTQLGTIRQQINATKEQIDLQNRAILSERKPNGKRVEQIDNQLKHNIIQSPINGTVLNQYLYKGEFATLGKPLFKIANLDEMILKAYFTGDQLASIKLGQMIKVQVDSGKDEFTEIPGKIIWISSNAEFTPKTIQTKDERANLVYAIKIKVKNNGQLKIGMYGEVIL